MMVTVIQIVIDVLGTLPKGFERGSEELKIRGLAETIQITALLRSARILRRVIRGCPRGVMVKAMDCGIVVSEFVFQSRYYVHFRANTLGKGMNPLILSAIG